MDAIETYANRVLITGSREWTERKFMYSILDARHQLQPIDLLIEGEARGADLIGKDWAIANGIDVLGIAATWNQHIGCNHHPEAPLPCKFQGHRRNQRMLVEGQPHRVYAFHGYLYDSRGTLDMLIRARLAGVPTTIFPRGNDSELASVIVSIQPNASPNPCCIEGCRFAQPGAVARWHALYRSGAGVWAPVGWYWCDDHVPREATVSLEDPLPQLGAVAGGPVAAAVV